MTPQPHRGFTYLMVLWWVAISSVVLAALGQQWMIESRRQRDIELVFRGDQIRQALDSFSDPAPTGHAKRLPMTWQELLHDTRQPEPVRHLRQLWPDPVTGGSWGVIREGPFIKGVFSTSKGRPLRAPERVGTYDAWRFEQGQGPIRTR